ncbi:MAG: tyrosine-type recombinase/integrase [Desulfuromonadaceae bacterium]|nr:tyrosine-type recombinase/integrase [Desulfuromonadaceae bacterium]
MTKSNVIARTFPDLDIRNYTEKDVIKILGWIEKNNWSDSTKVIYKVTLKKLLLFQKNDHLAKMVNPGRAIYKPKLPEEILTEDEIKSMIENADTPRNKAFISGIYEAGARISEFGTLKLKHVVFDEFGIRLTVNGKTGMRIVRLIFSVPFMISWINIHPYKNDPNAPLWVTDKKAGFKPRQMEYAGFRKIVKTIAEISNIKKRVYNQLFRHTRATHLALKVSESQMKIIFGWTADSNMPKIYIHLSGVDVDDTILKLYGLKKEEETESVLTIKNCIRCKQNIPTIGNFCPVCGMIQNTETALQLQNFEAKAKNLMFKIIKDNPELIKILEEIQ